MTDEPQNEAFSLDVDVSAAELDYPCFPAQIVPARIVSFSRQASKESGTPMTVITFKSESPLTTTSGTSKPPGFPFTLRIMGGPSLKNPAWDWEKAQRDWLGQVRFAALGERTGSFGQTEQYIGKVVGLKIKVKDGRNEIERIVRVGQ